jgi:hypothetical protein
MRSDGVLACLSDRAWTHRPCTFFGETLKSRAQGEIGSSCFFLIVDRMKSAPLLSVCGGDVIGRGSNAEYFVSRL